jgi:hypothetical protein
MHACCYVMIRAFVSYVHVPKLTVDFLACRMSSSGGDGGRRRSSRLEKGKAVVYASSPHTDDEYESMEGPAERASRQLRSYNVTMMQGVRIRHPAQVLPSKSLLSLLLLLLLLLDLLRFPLEVWHLGEHRLQRDVGLLTD